jgi:hypothetical protein
LSTERKIIAEIEEKQNFERKFFGGDRWKWNETLLCHSLVPQIIALHF